MEESVNTVLDFRGYFMLAAKHIVETVAKYKWRIRSKLPPPHSGPN